MSESATGPAGTRPAWPTRNVTVRGARRPAVGAVEGLAEGA